MRVALVHDYLKEFGGAERVLEAMREIWPKAPVYTAFVDWGGLGPHAERIREWDIKTSWVQKALPVKKLHSPLRFITPWVWKYFDFSGYDAVITSSAWYIPRGIITKGKTKHICYMHTPPRYLYGYETASDLRKYWLVRAYGDFINHFLRMYDYNTAQNVDFFLANSKETQRRIEKFYRRKSEVIYPPVDLRWEVRNGKWDIEVGSEIDENEIKKSKNQEITPQESKTSHLALPASYYLCVSRLAKAKHIDLAIGACQKLGEPLVVVGKGRDLKRLKYKIQNQKSKIHFVGEVGDARLHKIYQNAKALIFPAKDEEFGIVPVEAMARGIPVIAYRSGGVVETVVEGKTGVFFNELSVKSLIKAIKQFNHSTIYPSACIKQAQKFSKEKFKREIKKFALDKVKSYPII